MSQGPPTAVPDNVVQSLSTVQQQMSRKDEQLSSAAVDALTSKAAQARQVGDFTVYKYYFQSFGWLSATIFIASVVANSALATLQCTCNHPACYQLIDSDWSLTCCSFSCMAEVVVGRRIRLIKRVLVGYLCLALHAASCNLGDCNIVSAAVMRNDDSGLLTTVLVTYTSGLFQNPRSDCIKLFSLQLWGTYSFSRSRMPY